MCVNPRELIEEAQKGVRTVLAEYEGQVSEWSAPNKVYAMLCPAIYTKKTK